MATTTLTAEQQQIIRDAVNYHTNDKPHYAHMAHLWLPEEAYDRTYSNPAGKPVSRGRALTADGDLKPGYQCQRRINDLGRLMRAEHERLLAEINSPGYDKIAMERRIGTRA